MEKKGGKLFGGTVPPNKKLFGGTVPPNKKLFGGTVPPNKILFGGTVLICIMAMLNLVPDII